MMTRAAAWWRELRNRPHLQPVLANFGWLSADKFFRLAAGLAVGAWVTRYLGPAQYGLLAYGLAIAGIVGMLPGLGLDALVRRELVRDPTQAGRLLGTTLLLRLAAGALAFGLLALAAGLFAEDRATRFVVLVTGLAVFQPAALTPDLWFQAKLLSKYTVIAQNIVLTVTSLARVALILMHAPFSWFVILTVADLPLTAGSLAVAYRSAQSQRTNWRWDGATARTLLGQSWPLLLSSVAILIYMRIDQVMLKHLAGDAETGRYAAAMRLTELYYLFPMMLAASFSPLLTQARADGPAVYERRMQRFFNLAVRGSYLAAIPGIFAAPWLIRFFFGSAYLDAAPVLALLTATLIPVALGVARHEYLVNEGFLRFHLIATILGALLNVALNLWWIPRWGGIGAAWATLVAHLVADLATSFFWPPLRHARSWQLRALGFFWGQPAASAART